jgi:aryl-alcohol dehydrogenase-like predicted oxidoreductase
MPLTLLDSPRSRLGLGLAAVGRPGYINLNRAADLPADRSVEAMAQRAHELLDHAYRVGIRYIDAARSYGRAEAFLADWLQQRGHRDVIVGSKWGYRYTGDWRIDAPTHEVKAHSTEAFDRQLTETRDLLGDRLDLYQVHSVTPESPALTDPVLHQHLADLAATGVTIGLSVSGPHQATTIRAALGVQVDGRRLFDCVQATWNLLEPSATAALVEASGNGAAVIIKEGVGNGRLASAATAPATLVDIAAALGATPDAVALEVILHQPWASVVLSGAVTLGQLSANLAAAEIDLDQATIERLLTLAEPAEDYWRTRAMLPWS